MQSLYLARIEAYVEPDNAASRRVAEAIGFREEGSSASANSPNTVNAKTWCFTASCQRT